MLSLNVTALNPRAPHHKSFCGVGEPDLNKLDHALTQRFPVCALDTAFEDHFQSYYGCPSSTAAYPPVLMHLSC